MKHVPVWTGFVGDDAKVQWDRPRDVARYIQQFRGDEVEVTIRRRRRARSLNQNAFWWGVVVSILAEHCGYTPDEMHDALKYKFLREEAEGPLVKVRGTSTLTTAEMTKLIDDVRLWSETELGCYIPLPNEVAA